MSEARVLSLSVDVPGRIELVSMDFPDGAYELVANVETTAGVGSFATQTIVIKNWQELVDEFEPPKKTSWFGTVDMSKTCDASPGWKYDADALFGDKDRKYPRGKTTEYLAWHSPGLRSFELTVYSCTKDFTDSIILSLSPDGRMWQDISYVVHLEDSNAEGWSKVLLTGWVDSEDINYLRVTLAEGEREPGAIQLGRLVLKSQTP